MGLPGAAAVLCITGTLLALASASQDGHLQVGLFPPCHATLSPEGPCERDGDGCPFVLNLPPVTVHLPKQLMDLERLVEELQMLKDNVDELRRICKDCSVSQTEKECKTQGAEEDVYILDSNAQKRDKNHGLTDEERREAEKTAPKEKMEQVVASGENVRIMERGKLDGKQTERDGMAADNHNSRLGNNSPTRNSTYGKGDPQIWQMIDRKKQTEAADEREDAGIKLEKGYGETGRPELHDKTIIDERDLSGKSHDPKREQVKHQEHMVNNRDETVISSRGDSGDGDIWHDKHHKASHEERPEKKFGDTEKTTKQPIARDRPVWRDKTHSDPNQMETDRGSEERGGEKSSNAKNRGKSAPKSSQSGRHVWPDETMESGRAERTEVSVKNGSADDDHSGQDQRESSREIKDEKTSGGRFRPFKNTGLMEGTGARSGGQATAPSHGFIDLDQAVTLTSPPSFTTSLLTTAVKEGQDRQMNGKSGIKKQFGVDVRLAGGHVKGDDGGEVESPDLEYRHQKEDIGRQYKPPKTQQVDSSSTFEHSTDLKQGNQHAIEPPTQSNLNRKGKIFEHSTFAKGAKQPAIPARNTDSAGERKTTQGKPSQTSQGKYINSEVSNPDTSSYTPGNKDSKTTDSVNYEFDQTKRGSTNDGSDAAPSTVIKNAHFNFDVKQGERKTAFELSQNNPDVHANVDQLRKNSESADSNPEFTIVTSDPTNSKSHFNPHFEQGQREASKEPSSANNSKTDSRKENTRPKIQSNYQTDIDATTSTPKVHKPKDSAHNNKKESYNVFQTNQDEQPTNPTDSSIDQLPKTSIPRITNYQEASQSNPGEKHHSTDHSIPYVESAKASAKDETISTPTVPSSHVSTHKVGQNELKGPQSQDKHTESEHSGFKAHLDKAGRTNAMDGEATTLYPTVSSSYTTEYFEKEHREIDKGASTTSDTNQKEPSDFDAPASKAHYNRNLNNGDRKTLQKPHHGQSPTNYNEKVNANDLQRVRNDPTSGHVEDITSSTPVFRQVSSFKDDFISTTLTSLQISPTTTSMTGNKRISSSRTVPNQRPKPSAGMKPEAKPKVKNPKNDHKLDRWPSPDSQVKNNLRPKHPKVTPDKKVQNPLRPRQSTPKASGPDDRVQPLKPRPPTLTSTLAPSVTGLHKDKMHRPSAQGETGVKQEEIHKASGGKEDGSSKLKHFIQKAGNGTRNVPQTHNRSSEFNNATQRINTGVKKTPKVNVKAPQTDQKPKQQAPKAKPVQPKVATGQKVKPVSKANISRVNKFTGFKNGTKVLPGPKQPNKPVRPKAVPATKTKPKAKESSHKTDFTPTAAPVKLTTARDPEADPFRQTVTDVSAINQNSRVLSTDPTPTTVPNKPSSAPTTPAGQDLNPWGKAPRSQAPWVQPGPTALAAFTGLGSTVAPPPRRGPKAPAVESTTPSARELRVKINQVAAFFNKSSPQPGRPLDPGPGDPREDGKKTAPKSDIQPVRDCSDHMVRGHTRSGQYLVTPDPRAGSVPVLCEMEVDGGGWTVLQRRQDGSVSFNRTWAEYRDGFGRPEGEFWLGNQLLHLLTWDRNMELRVEMEDFEGVREHAQYQLFRVASERMRYRLSVDGYSGTAGDALRFSSQYDHNNRAFTTPDRDNDRYPSGNCGAYYSSGWWFDACMAANLNGRYYSGRYRGVRDGIYWGTWHNISTEYYPTNERLAFRRVTMMTRPRGFKL